MLFQNIDEVKNHTEVGAISFKALKKSIRLAEVQYVKPIIGAALYTALDTALAATPTTSLPEKYEKLLFLIRDALGPLASYIFIPKGEVQLTDVGAMRAETPTNKSAFQYQVTNQRAQLLKEGVMMLEEVLSFLEANKTDYSEWTGSNEFKKYRGLFIKTAGEFQLLYSSATPFRNYYFMRSVMAHVEEKIIKKAIGTPQYDALKEKDADADAIFTDEEKELVRQLKHCIAYYTIAKGMINLAVQIDDTGITVMSSPYGTNDESGKRIGALDNQLSQLQRQAEADGGQWLADAMDYLKATASETVFEPWYTEQQTLLQQEQEEEQNQQEQRCGNGTAIDFEDSPNNGIYGAFTL